MPMEPHNIPMVVLGSDPLVRMVRFNAGSEAMVDGITVSALTVTNTATGMAALLGLMSWAHTGKPSIVGAASGAVHCNNHSVSVAGPMAASLWELPQVQFVMHCSQECKKVG